MLIRKGDRRQPTENADRVVIFIGDTKYTILETIDGKLNINKTSDGLNENMSVFPKYSNVIEIL